ncbi:MAG: carboxy-S-adenosyl-L-methionine synthase CmoA [Gammaproteobacteria bacterium]|nr:carboxy-S-adenosyl-L-methionine synthase CmoA [Gammaproteobacteria bacterium]
MSKLTEDERRDRIYRSKRTRVEKFEFNEQVVSVFPDMVRRSIPGYDTIIQLTGVLAAQHLVEGALCYDLGCSLGAATISVLKNVGTLDISIEAVDSSAPMIEAARAIVTDPRVRFHIEDIRRVKFKPSSVVIMSFVLQFLPPEDRLDFLTTVRKSMNPGGLLVLSEKIESFQEFDRLHTEFKKANNYSELEISQKRQALERVMQIDSEHTHFNRLSQAGFRQPRRWFHCLNWNSFIANA